MSVRKLKSIDRRVPSLIAAWPGMGQVGVGAASYLRARLNGVSCAEMDVTPYVFPDSIEVRAGIGTLPPMSSQQVCFVEEPPLLLFEGEAQVAGEAGVVLAGELLDFASRHGVETVYTGAAFATAMSYRDEVKVYGVATDERLRNRFAAYGVEPLSEGRISGLNGLLLGLAGTRGMSGACFLATMPQYAVHTSNPRASRALLRVFEQILNTTIDMSDLERDIERTDRLLGEFESRVNSALQGIQRQFEETDRPGSDAGEERPEPQEITRRIEELFEQASRDRDAAGLLKQELDRWGLFGLYEDRFLDLFDRSNRPD